MTDLPIYLDHNATTPLLPEVVEAMLPYLRRHFDNPSSGHAYGREARAGVERAREQVARLLGCQPDEVFFTSGGTEANNLAIRGVTDAAAQRRHVVTTAIEHPATANPCRHLQTHGWRVDHVGVDASCRVRLDELGSRLGDETALVTVIHANNETWTLQSIAEIAALSHRHGAVMHTDAAQSVGKVAVTVDALGVDLLSIAGHKLNAPKGVGALYVRRGTPIEPFTRGAGHERGLRPGTENVASLVGLGVACASVAAGLASRTAHLLTLRDHLWHLLTAAIPGVKRNGHATEQLPNTLSVRFPGVRGTALLDATPEIAASTGSACHEGHESASSVLLAMGLGAEEALETVRLSVGTVTSADEIERAGAALVNAWRVVSRAGNP
ncbi:MAG TPA: cysteine desulfurase family protein [Labilithrix sp.]|nr:cysteine desulfurase family protein [Labilithrix sp.]